MIGSESLWNEEDLLREMEAMQDQIEELQLKDRQHLSEISDLRSMLQQAQRKIQEQSERIVRMNSADLILKDNEKLKEEISAVIAEASTVKKNCEIKEKRLEASQKEINKRKEEIRQMIKKEQSLIEDRAKKLTEEKTRQIQKKNTERIRNIQTVHKKRSDVCKKCILMSLLVMVSSFVLAAFIAEEWCFTFIAIINELCVIYLIFQGIKILKL